MTEDDELYLMANLRPVDTGLPMVVWVSEGGRAWHGARVKVAMAHGHRADPYNTASVSVRPAPQLVAGQLSPADLRAVSDWIRLNEAVIVGYWDGSIGIAQLIQQLRRI
jgi:hypothetical protein